MMNPVAREVFELISAMGIGYQYVEHPPVETIEDCFAPAEALNAVIPKNLFLCPGIRAASIFCWCGPMRCIARRTFPSSWASPG